MTSIKSDIEIYFAGFPAETQKKLQQVREIIKLIAPDASEKISYGIPTFYLGGNLVHYAAYKNHIGFYPGAGGIEAFEAELSHLKRAKGSVQFPLNEPLPVELISKITKFRLDQNLGKAKLKSTKKQKDKM